jgi:glycosyltransferase involved in cell wall biosynthesis
VSDDSSADTSVDIVKEYSKRSSCEISLLPSVADRLGAAGSFSRLLESSTAEYLMFSDQDDVWLPHKLEKTLERIQQLEDRYGKKTPLLIHTDLKVVNNALEPIAESFWDYQNIHPKKRESLNRLLPQNVVTGCTVMINSSLRKLALPIPQQAIMHDWWLALVAAAFGQIEHIDEATLLYRQHGNNEIGAKRWGNVRNLATVVTDKAGMNQSLLNTQVQAKAFLAQYFERLSPKQRQLVATYASLNQSPKPVRLYNLLKYKYFKAGFLRNLGLFLRI